MTREKKPIKVYHLLSEEATLKKMPKFNGFGIGYGPQRNKKKYSRKEKHRSNFLDENVDI